MLHDAEGRHVRVSEVKEPERRGGGHHSRPSADHSRQQHQRHAAKDDLLAQRRERQRPGGAERRAGPGEQRAVAGNPTRAGHCRGRGPWRVRPPPDPSDNPRPNHPTGRLPVAIANLPSSAPALDVRCGRWRCRIRGPAPRPARTPAQSPAVLYQSALGLPWISAPIPKAATSPIVRPSTPKATDQPIALSRPFHPPPSVADGQSSLASFGEIPVTSAAASATFTSAHRQERQRAELEGRRRDRR